MKVSGFFDLNIPIQSEKITKELCETLINLKYNVVALNQTIEEEVEENNEDSKRKKKKKNTGKDIVPCPTFVNLPEECKRKLTIFHRITIIFSKPQYLLKVNQSPNLKKYDIISVIPTSQDAFQFATTSKDVDLISFDASNKINFRMNRKLYNIAVSQNIYFEIPYAPATTNSTCRKNTIQTAHLYHTYGKSKNIIVSSGACNHYHLRGPYDIINLGLLFGLSEGQSKCAVTTTCRALLLRARGRKFGKSAMTMVASNVDQESESESEMEIEDEGEPTAKRLCSEVIAPTNQ